MRIGNGVGYLVKDTHDLEAVLAALHGVAAGGIIMDPHLIEKLLTRLDRVPASVPILLSQRDERRKEPLSRARPGRGRLVRRARSRSATGRPGRASG